MILKEELYKIIDQIPIEKQIIAKSFLEWLNLQNSLERKTKRISLQGITDGSNVTDQDIQEVKKIWRSH